MQRVAYQYLDGRLVRKAWLRPDPDRETPIVERTILGGIRNLTVGYAKEGVWIEEWRLQITGENQTLLPDAIRLEAELETGETLRFVFLTGVRS